MEYSSDRTAMLILNTKRIDKVVSGSFILAEGGLLEEKLGRIDYNADKLVIEPSSMESLINEANYYYSKVRR